eukprot:6213709-Pleurochrysis_carterae.AAC.1
MAHLAILGRHTPHAFSVIVLNVLTRTRSLLSLSLLPFPTLQGPFLKHDHSPWTARETLHGCEGARARRRGKGGEGRGCLRGSRQPPARRREASWSTTAAGGGTRCRVPLHRAGEQGRWGGSSHE